MSEDVHPQWDRLDAMSTRDLVGLMQAEDLRAVEAVAAHVDRIADAIEAIASRIRGGGTLHYFGAGTSGRIAELDAAEIAPTFGVDAVAAHAAGDGAAEDDAEKGTSDAQAAGLTAGDVVLGVSASGSTAYVLAAVRVARAHGAMVIGLSCAAHSQLSELADVAIEIETGPEVIAGSTRLKSGTVQKVVLNMISTGVFVKLGHTYRGRMTGVVAANAKQHRRAVKLIHDLTGVPAADAEIALVSAGGSAKAAVLMLRRKLGADEAAARLHEHDGDLAAALGERAHA
ncbi:MAG TPA: N-acetylmuramic acid 6-phosphate etherase [Candidatus Dormibacteraeota bacterium]|nr:N-acetylmuramic acid 6-phosphate etherase [Candidatus Dormibacteraeota bacterium]